MGIHFQFKKRPVAHKRLKNTALNSRAAGSCRGNFFKGTAIFNVISHTRFLLPRAEYHDKHCRDFLLLKCMSRAILRAERLFELLLQQEQR